MTTSRDLAQIKKDNAVIKDILLDEGEPTAWVKRALAEARETSIEHCVSHERVGEMLREDEL